MIGLSLPKYAVIDDIFPSQLADDVLSFAISNERHFQPTQVQNHKFENVDDTSFRVSERCSVGLAEHEKYVREALLARFEDLCALTGVKPFHIEFLELELVAHRNEGFYHTHIDTATGDLEAAKPSRRVLSSVSYLHKRPRRNQGGELRIRGFDGSEGQLIEPRHNRLVAFPSIAPHEVLPTRVPGDAFRDARFSVNCWFHDRRSGA